MFSLSGEVTAKETRSLQVSAGFGEFLTNISRAHSGHPGWSHSITNTSGLDHFGKRQLQPCVVSWPTKHSEHHTHREEPLTHHGQDSPKQSPKLTLHVVERQQQSSTSISQENLLAIKTFWGCKEQSYLQPPAPPTTNCLSAYSPSDSTLDLAFYWNRTSQGLWCLFSFQAKMF